MKKTGIPQFNLLLDPSDTATDSYLKSLNGVDKNLAYREKPKELLSTIQTALTRFGYSGLDGKPLKGDGIYDADTDSALSEFLDDEDDTDANIQKLSENLKKHKIDDSMVQQDEKAKKAGFAGGKKDILSVFEKPLPNHSIQKLPDHLKDNGQEAIRRTPLSQEMKDSAYSFCGSKQINDEGDKIYWYVDEVATRKSDKENNIVRLIQYETKMLTKDDALDYMNTWLEEFLILNSEISDRSTSIVVPNFYILGRPIDLSWIFDLTSIIDLASPLFENQYKKRIEELFEQENGDSIEIVVSTVPLTAKITENGLEPISYGSDYKKLGRDY